MWYLIGAVAVVLLGFFIWASMHKHKGGGKKEEPPFRSEKDLETYEKNMDSRLHVDFDDAE